MVKLYKAGGKTVLVACDGGDRCPKLNFTKGTLRVKDDFSNGFKTTANLFKAVFC